MNCNLLNLILFLILLLKVSYSQEISTEKKINKNNNEISKESSPENKLENENIVVLPLSKTSVQPIIATQRDNSKTISIEPTYIRVFYRAPESIVPRKLIIN